MTDTFNYNNNKLIILPGNCFNINELKSRLHSMDTPFDENSKHKKGYYEQLYNEALKFNENKLKIITSLITDTNNKMNSNIQINRQFEENQYNNSKNIPEKIPKFPESNNFTFKNYFNANNETNQKPFYNYNQSNITFPKKQTNDNNTFQTQKIIMNDQRIHTNTPYNQDKSFTFGNNNYNDIKHHNNYNINQETIKTPNNNSKENFNSLNNIPNNQFENNNNNINNNQFPNNSNYSNNQNQQYYKPKNFEFNTPNQNNTKNFPQSSNNINFNNNETNKNNQNYNYYTNNNPSNFSNNPSNIITPNQNQNISFQNSNDVNEAPNDLRTSNINYPNNNFQKPITPNYPFFNNDSNNNIPLTNFPNNRRNFNNLYSTNNNMRENNDMNAFKNFHNDFPNKKRLINISDNEKKNNLNEETSFFNKERIDIIYSLLTGLFGAVVLGLTVYFMTKHSSSISNFFNEGVNSISNPKKFFVEFLYGNLVLLFKKLYTDYIYYAISLIIIIIVFFFLKKKMRRENLLNRIFDELKNSLIEMSNNNEENGIRGIPESEIINTYCLKYNIPHDEFIKNYFPALNKMRKKNPNIKQYEDEINGCKQLIWYWNN